MLDHGLRAQVAAALRHALALTGPEQYHRDVALILEVMTVAWRLGVVPTYTELAQDMLDVGFPEEALLDQTLSDQRLMLALESINDILEGHRLTEPLPGLLGMTRWLYVCLQNGDRQRLRAMAERIELRRGTRDVLTVQSQELH